MIAQANVKSLPVASETVDLIFTDPPYPTKYLQTYEWLANEAMRILKPGGWLVCMAGGLNVNKIYRMFDDAGLTYFFTMMLKSSGDAPTVWKHLNGKRYPIVARAKHLLVYSKGPAIPEIGGVMNLFETSGSGWATSKRYHHWGQDVNTCRYYIEYFSRPGDLVVDPFVGGGTTMVAAKLVDRRCIGFDIDFSALRSTQMRLDGTSIPETLPLFAMTQAGGD